MKSKGYKIIVGVLVALIVVLGAALAAKTFLPADERELSEGKAVPEGAVGDVVISQTPSGDYDVATPKA